MRRATVTKARAALGRKSFKGSALAYPAGVQARYAKALGSLVAQMTSQTKREAVRLFESHGFAMDASPASQARILTNALMTRFADMFARRAPGLANQMVDGASKASTSALHASLKQASGGVSLKTSHMPRALVESYKASVAENVALIKSIATDYQNQIQGAVMRSLTSGEGLKSLIPELEKYEGVTHRRAKFIATDQTRKAYGAANRDRLKALGVTKFEWIHSGGGAHPRPQHEDWNGQIFSFDDLPVDDKFGPVTPGQIPNCRCTMRPVLFTEPEENE